MSHSSDDGGPLAKLLSKIGRSSLRARWTARDERRRRELWRAMGLDPDREVTPIPAPPAGSRVVRTTHLAPLPAVARVLWDGDSSTFVYELIEPPLEGPERTILEKLRQMLLRSADPRVDDVDRAAHLADSADRLLARLRIRLDKPARARIMYHLHRDFLGQGPIDALLLDADIEDVSCDGPDVPIYAFHRVYESIRTNVVFRDEAELDRFVVRLAQRCGKQISIADPILDGTLPDGSRLQATLAREVTTRGSSFTIRKFRQDPYTPADLLAMNTLDARLAAYLWMCMEEGRSMLFVGGTASGKTTTLNACSLFIPPHKKIVSIEETREIRLAHENWIASATRSGFAGESEGNGRSGAVDMYRLLEAALRQRPEYIIVGEVRGRETFTLFQAMSTGHAVYSTMHADSVQSAVHRLENEPINIPRVMVQQAEVMVILGAVRVGDRLVRRIREVVEISGVDPATGDLLTNTAFRWDAESDTHPYLGSSEILAAAMDRRRVTSAEIQEEWDRRRRVLEWAAGSGIRRFDEFAAIIASYYRTPEMVLARVAKAEREQLMLEVSP